MPSRAAFVPTTLSIRAKAPTFTTAQSKTPLPTISTPTTAIPHYIPHPFPSRHPQLSHSNPSSPPLTTPPSRILLWHHTDLRIADNPALLAAAAKAANPSSVLLPVAAAAALDNVATPLLQELAAHFDRLGSALMTVRGPPEKILPQLCAKFKLDVVYFNRSVMASRVAVEKRVENALRDAGVRVEAFWGNVLAKPMELEMKRMPLIKDLGKDRRENLDKVGGTPERLPPLPASGGAASAGAQWAQGKFGGGSSRAVNVLARMRKETETLVLAKGAHLIVQLKLYLDYGALSPKMVASRCRDVLGKITGRTFSELVWRDYVAIAAHRAVGVRQGAAVVA